MSHHLIHLLLGKLVNACPSSATEIIPVPSFVPDFEGIDYSDIIDRSLRHHFI